MYRTLFLILILSACTADVKEYSGAEKEELSRIMVDVHMAQAALRRASLIKRDSLENVYWKQIEMIHDMPREKIESRLEELKEQPEVLELVLGRAEDIVDSLKGGPRAPSGLINR